MEEKNREQERGKQAVYRAMKGNGWMRLSEICAEDPGLRDATSQTISGLLRYLYLNGQVDKKVENRITCFKLMDFMFDD